MGLDLTVSRSADRIPLAALLARLAERGLPSSVMMIDGQLVHPQAPLPAAFRDVRLRTPAGTVTLARRGDAVAVVVFGNADAALQQAQQAVAAAVESLE